MNIKQITNIVNEVEKQKTGVNEVDTINTGFYVDNGEENINYAHLNNDNKVIETALTADCLNCDNVGDVQTPIYFNDGLPTVCNMSNYAHLNNDNKVIETALTADCLNCDNVGDVQTPIYFNDGLPTVCNMSNYATTATATTDKNGLMSANDKTKLNAVNLYTFKFKTFTISHSQCLPWQRGANLTYYKAFTFSQFGVTGPIISCQLSNWSGGTDTSTWTQLYLDNDNRFIINSDTERSFTTLYIRVVYI